MDTTHRTQIGNHIGLHMEPDNEEAPEGPLAETQLPPPVTSRHEHSSPAVTWYRTIVLTSTICFGTWKMVATIQNAAAASIALDYLTGVVLAAALYVLGECKNLPSLRWLFCHNVISDVRCLPIYGVRAVVTTRRVFNRRLRPSAAGILVTVLHTRCEGREMAFSEAGTTSGLSILTLEPFPELPAEIVNMIIRIAIETFVEEYVEQSLAAPLYSEDGWDEISFKQQNPVVPLLEVNYWVREATLSFTAIVLSIPAVHNSHLSSLSVRPWTRIEQIRSLGRTTVESGTWREALDELAPSPLAHAYAALYIAQRKADLAICLCKELVELEDDMECALLVPSGEVVAECPMLRFCQTSRFCQDHIDEVNFLVDVAKQASLQFPSMKLLSVLCELDIVPGSISARARTASLSLHTSDSQKAVVLDHLILHIRGSRGDEDILLRSLTALRAFMTEIGKSVISGLDTITSTSPWHYLDGNIRDKLRQSLLNFMEYKLPDIDDLSVLELHSAAITGASDLLESFHPYTWD